MAEDNKSSEFENIDDVPLLIETSIKLNLALALTKYCGHSCKIFDLYSNG